MSLVIEPQHVPLSTDTDGVIRLSGTRVTLDTVIDAFEDGASAEEIALRYPALSLPDIYAAITYYLKNRAAVESYLSERRESASAVRHANEQRFDLGGLRERLLQRRRDASV
jgi:uncharacterized protein (DUF433 family)